MSTSPSEGTQVQIDAAGFPIILDAILNCPASWTAMRGTCRKYRTRADSQAFSHILVNVTRTSGTDLAITVRAPHGYLPVFPRPAPWKWYRSPRTPSALRLLRSCLPYFQLARVVDMPGFGIVPGELCHLISCFLLLDVLRFYDCGFMTAADQGGSHWCHANSWPEASVHPESTVVLFPYVPDTGGPADFPEPWHYPTVRGEVGKVVVNVLYSKGTGPYAPPIPHRREDEEELEREPLALNETVFIFRPIEKAVLCDCGEDLVTVGLSHDCERFASTVVERISRWTQVAIFVARELQKDILTLVTTRQVRLVDYPSPDPEEDSNYSIPTREELLSIIEARTQETWAELASSGEPLNITFLTWEEYTAGMTPRQIELETEVGHTRLG